MLGDLVSAARRHVIGGPGVAESTQADLPVLDIGRASRTRYRISLSVVDRPGVLAADRRHVQRARGQGRGVSAVRPRAPSRCDDGAERTATLVIGTHEATESALAATVAALAANESVVERRNPCSESKGCRPWPINGAASSANTRPSRCE